MIGSSTPARPPDLARPLAGRDHDVLGADLARGGRHGPGAALADEPA